jgi:hypothetical protein
MDSPRLPTRSRAPTTPRPAFQPVVSIEIDAVTRSDRGFTLTGPGASPDRGFYRVDLRFDLPLDPRTRTVLGELLSQSDLTVSRSDTPTRNS